MIGSSVTDPHWLEEVSADRPTLVVAEGLVMYLTEDDVRRLFVGIVDRFPSGLLLFDAISSLGLRLQRFNRAVQAAGAKLTWGLQDPGPIERWDRRIKLVTALSALDLPGIDRLPRSSRSWSGR
jgi:O-methyltransferase involved in polyketide biosynthesis